MKALQEEAPVSITACFCGELECEQGPSIARAVREPRHTCTDTAVSFLSQKMVGRGQRAMRLHRSSSKQEMQNAPRKEQNAETAKPAPVEHHLWPAAVKRRCFALLRKVQLAKASHACDFQVTKSTPSTGETTFVWPVTARRHARRLWLASRSE